jgi:hypothetical protein
MSTPLIWRTFASPGEDLLRIACLPRLPNQDPKIKLHRFRQDEHLDNAPGLCYNPAHTARSLCDALTLAWVMTSCPALPDQTGLCVAAKQSW